MLYYFLYSLKYYASAFNVFRYITVRAACAALTSLLIGIVLGPTIIRLLYQLKIGQPIRKEHCEPLFALHAQKKGTPTMGGVLIVISVMISSLLWADIMNSMVWVCIMSITWLGFLGFIDDYIKVTRKSSVGLCASKKLLGQIFFALLLGVYIYSMAPLGAQARSLIVPCLKLPLIADMGILYIVFITFMLVGTSNAVNLTDGLDGLAIGCMIFATLIYAIYSYVSGHMLFAQYLQILHVPGSGELAVFCSSIVGASLGFLWFNAFPAQMFMGDTGSLALGGALATVAVLIKQELALIIVGGIFVIEALSVIMQVISFRLTGRRIFAIAPLHHHFQIKGWAETKVTVRFWIIAIIFSLIGIGLLKIR